ncbi:MAG TPA: NAD-dependent epimerase/dehydratase family protein [Thermoanaerobaculia bacterium]|nr:NAD-dependent epimerase/dehydratase family protein [Thermoanaerobaculia bacterium]
MNSDRKMLVTGSSGLIGSEVVEHFDELGWKVHGIDNNTRADLFGAAGDTRWNQRRLEKTCSRFEHHEVDIRDRGEILRLVAEVAPDAIVHTAAQPSHDLAARRPFDDFDINAVGTLNLLEAARRSVPETVFVAMSTNKVYGDVPNEIPLRELESRWDYEREEDQPGIAETMRIDRSKHSLFGASKVAADIMVQEYGRYFGMKSCCLRGGCLTGPHHSGVELHGFLSYLTRVNLEGGIYTIFGYKGKQVRDNIHAADVVAFIERFIAEPRSGEVYNLGGGRNNSCSILEAFEMVEALTGKRMRYKYVERNREGDHICYISNLSKAQAHYPGWGITRSLEDILNEIVSAWTDTRLGRLSQGEGT